MPVIAFVAAAGLLFVVIYLVSDSAQKYLYDDVVDGLWWRSLVAALPLAALQLLWPVRLEEMFITTLHWTILQAVAWFVVFWSICRYMVRHAAFVGIVSFFLFSWMVTMAVDSLHSLSHAR